MTVAVTGEDLVSRYDIETVGELATDDRVRLLRSDVPTHPNVLVALKAAEGEVLARIRIGQRYSTTDLDNLDEYSLEHFKSIVCTAALARLFQRRPGIHAEMAKAIKEEALDWMQRLAGGEEIFSLNNDSRHLDASVPSIEGPTSLEIVNRNFLTARMAGHHIPDVADRNPLDRG